MILDTSAHFTKYFLQQYNLYSSASRVAELKPVLTCDCKGDGEEWKNSGAWGFKVPTDSPVAELYEKRS